MKNLINLRFGHGTWDEILAERKRRILQTDAYRKENFGDMFPLLNNILKIYD